MGKAGHTGQQRQRVSTDSSCELEETLSAVFPFWKGAENPLPGVAGPASFLFRVLALAASVVAVAVAQAKARWPQTSLVGVTALALAERRPARLPFWTQAEEAAKRSGATSRPGNEVFALLGRTGTGHCPVGLTEL